jgi:hypothetical protein
MHTVDLHLDIAFALDCYCDYQPVLNLKKYTLEEIRHVFK